MGEFFSVMFRAITGFKLTPETLITLGFFFVLGWLFGKLTRNIGIIKGIALAIFGGLALTLMSVLPGAFVFFFIAGVLTNHGPLLVPVLYWAHDIADFFYALQYRQAFEDIRAEEVRAEQEFARARAEAYARAHSHGESASQARWRKEAKQGAENTGAGEKEKTTGGAKRQKEPPRGSSGRSRGASKSDGTQGDTLKGKYLKVLGLQPGQDYRPDEIRKAYRKRAKETHPDAGGDAQVFMDVRAAYLALRGAV